MPSIIGMVSRNSMPEILPLIKSGVFPCRFMVTPFPSQSARTAKGGGFQNSGKAGWQKAGTQVPACFPVDSHPDPSPWFRGTPDQTRDFRNPQYAGFEDQEWPACYKDFRAATVTPVISVSPSP